MTQIEQIILEIERLKIEKRKENLPYYDGYDAACNKIIAYLNSLPAEQPSEELKDKANYKISNALYSCEPQEFNSDEEAWNTLRTKFHNSFQWLWKEVEIEIPINNEKEYVEAWNHKYGPRPIGYSPENTPLKVVGEKNIETMWIPVLVGITSHPYNVTKQY